MTILMIRPRSKETATPCAPHVRSRCAAWHNLSTMANAKPLTRLYFRGDIAAHGEARLPPAAAHHVQHVLRLHPGAALTLFDGEGVEHDAVIVRVGQGGVTVQGGAQRAGDRESPLRIVLAQGGSAGERMDYTIQ